MNKKRIVSLLLALAMIFALAGCTSSEPAQPAEPSEPEASGSAITVTDMTGREITLDEPATRVVALSAADCEFLYAVGAGLIERTVVVNIVIDILVAEGGKLHISHRTE